ncbi:MAG: class I SAM-dependent methyltransferase, partial [Rhodospirillaceae bacterium]|nr:class I SAM-dependent methyltransferase [Rhodospirillaceae bacterium]
MLTSYLSPPSFWTPRFAARSAWIDHAPFAFWLMGTVRPRALVELGTHSGYSYFAFCQAVADLGLPTRCFAVDTWQGDTHAGYYEEEFFRSVADYNDAHYAAFSRLVRSTFDDALAHFTDGTVDLLHIDGRHFYDDAKHDFDSWRPKLSDRAVVLFHDTNVRERDFGVYRLWEQLRERYPSFEFFHGHGLGVLGVGPSLPEGMREFFAVTADAAGAA